MKESAVLASARQHLSRAESGFQSADGLAHLEEGLALLEQVLLEGAARDRKIAANLLSTYAERICQSVQALVHGDRAIPEPQLEQLFKVLLALDAAGTELPSYVRQLKIEIARRLVDFYYEGHSAEEKQKVLEQLTGMAAGEP
jgi:hypothetical protein